MSESLWTVVEDADKVELEATVKSVIHLHLEGQ